MIGGLSVLIFSTDTNGENMKKEASEKLPQGQLVCKYKYDNIYVHYNDM